MASSNNADAKGSVLTKIGRDHIHSAHLQQYFKAFGSSGSGALVINSANSHSKVISLTTEITLIRLQYTIHPLLPLQAIEAVSLLAFRVQNLTFGLHISVNTNTHERMKQGIWWLEKGVWRVVERSMGSWKSTLWKMKSNNRYQYSINQRVAFARAGGGDILQLGK